EQHPGAGAGRFDRPAVDGDQIFRLDLGAELGDLIAVDGDPAGGDQPLGVAAGGDSGAGEELLQPLGGHQGFGGSAGSTGSGSEPGGGPSAAAAALPVRSAPSIAASSSFSASSEAAFCSSSFDLKAVSRSASTV